MNMCQQGRKYHISLVMSATDGLFACRECALEISGQDFKTGQSEYAFVTMSACVCVFYLDSWLISLVSRCSLVNKGLKEIDYGSLFLMTLVLFMCGTQGSEQSAVSIH